MELESYRKLLRGKIHRATITHADLEYEGSVSLPPELLEAAGFAEHEAVWIWNVTNGSRLETYTIKGEPGSGEISINGAAAHLNSPGDIVIIAAFGLFPESEVERHQPKVVFVDAENRIVHAGPEVAGPQLRIPRLKSAA